MTNFAGRMNNVVHVKKNSDTTMTNRRVPLWLRLISWHAGISQKPVLHQKIPEQVDAIYEN
jgi:hypothetical protein